MNRSIIFWSALVLALIIGCEKHQTPLAPAPESQSSSLTRQMPEIPADLKAKILDELTGSDAGASGLQKSSGVIDFIDLLGDIDNFHPGDPVDNPGCLTDESGSIVTCMGGDESNIPHFDEPDVVDRPMAFAHFFCSQFAGSLPANGKIKDAVLIFRFKGNREDVLNDFILFLNPCNAAIRDELPIIAIPLKDLLDGDAPGAGEVHAITLNLRKAPVRKFSSYEKFLQKLPGPGEAWHGGPDKKNFDLLKYFYKTNPNFHGYMDVAFIDCDLTLDYSIFAGTIKH